MLIGHIAVAILEKRYLGTELAPTLAGGLFPDVLDKTLCQVLHLVPNGRTWGHTIFTLAVSSVMVRLLAGRATARSWALGFIGHLLADLRGDLPLWYPFKSYDFEPSPGFKEIVQRFLADRSEVALEVVLLILALLAWSSESTSGVTMVGGPR